jgi:hypothetical protein
MKSFILYTDNLSVLDQLSDEQAGKLFKAIVNYHNGQEIAISDDLKLIFFMFKKQFERDREKYDKKCERNRLNGLKGGRPSITLDNPVGFLATEKSETNQTQPKKAYNNNDNNNNNNNDNDNNIKESNVVSNDVFVDLLSFANATFKTKRTVFSTSVKNKYKARFKEGYTIEMVKRAMVNASKSKHHMETGYKYCTLEFFSRPEKLDMWSADAEVKPAYNPRA